MKIKEVKIVLSQLLGGGGLAKASEIYALGVAPQQLARLAESGFVEKTAPGVYSMAGVPPSATFDLETLARLYPKGVFCLVTALRFHELTDENPHTHFIAFPHGTQAPTSCSPPAEFCYFSGRAFSDGIEEHETNGTKLKVYSIDKSIADCFKFRNRIGLDVALAALRQAAAENRLDRNKLWEFSKSRRITRIIRPYLEFLG
jgi:predicted transcriptional regulator of viral defense system